MGNCTSAAKLCCIEPCDNATFVRPRPGARTRAIVATRHGFDHRLQHRHSRILVKFYKGNGTSEGAKAYQSYHQNWFHRIPALTPNRHVQQSLESGIHPDAGPYAILEYIEGSELAARLDARELDTANARHILEDILHEISIPLWNGGSRFKDCHPGNFIVTPAFRAGMIDSEQMRKDAEELLHCPAD